jgi:hypothetical protein
VIAVVALVFLGISLAGATGEGDEGEWAGLLIWLGASAVLAVVAVRYGSRLMGIAAAHGVAAGILLAAGDVVTKAVVSGGSRLVFIPAMIVCYSFGTIVLRLGFQKGAALTTAASRPVHSALPIIAGTTLYDEPFPNGKLGVLRGIAFALLIAGGALLSRPKPERAEGLRSGAGGLVTRLLMSLAPAAAAVDVLPAALERAEGGVALSFRRFVKAGKLDEGQVATATSRMRCSSANSGTPCPPPCTSAARRGRRWRRPT